MSKQSSRAPGLHGGLWTKAKPSVAVPSTPPVIVKHDVSPLPAGKDKRNVQETSNTAHTLFTVGGWITVDGNGKAHKTDNGRTLVTVRQKFFNTA